MPLPQANEARLFYRASIKRFDEARFLQAGSRYTGAVYLGGYAVECMLKALILSAVPTGVRGDMVSSFRGQRAHNFDWLRYQYLQHGGSPFPPAVASAFALVNTWDTDLRYETREVSPRRAGKFLRNAEIIITWADGRL